MAAILRMTVQQRLNLEGMLRQQKSEDGEALMTSYELLKKIRIPTEDRVLYMREIQTPQGPATEFFNRTINAAPSTDIELESAEIRRLEGTLKDWKNYSPEDVEWLIDLKKQLSAVNNGTAAAKKKSAN